MNVDGYGLLPGKTVYTHLCALNTDTVLAQLMLPAYAAIELVTVSGREIPPPTHKCKSALVHAMTALEGGAGDFYSFLNSTLDGGEWPASRPGPLYPLRNNCVTLLIEG